MNGDYFAARIVAYCNAFVPEAQRHDAAHALCGILKEHADYWARTASEQFRVAIVTGDEDTDLLREGE